MYETPSQWTFARTATQLARAGNHYRGWLVIAVLLLSAMSFSCGNRTRKDAERTVNAKRSSMEVDHSDLLSYEQIVFNRPTQVPYVQIEKLPDKRPSGPKVIFCKSRFTSWDACFIGRPLRSGQKTASFKWVRKIDNRLWKSTELGSGDEGLQALFAALAELPEGAVVLIHPLPEYSGEKNEVAVPFHPLDLEQVVSERRLTIVFSTKLPQPATRKDSEPTQLETAKDGDTKDEEKPQPPPAPK